MYSPVGVSKYVFPALPILSSIGIVMLLFTLPGFIKTRSIPLISFIVVVIYSNLINIINTILWRNNIEDWAPVYCRITTAIGLQLNLFIPAAILCVCRIVWIISGSRPMQRLHDQRRKSLIIDIVLCIAFPLISSVLVPFSIVASYAIIEDVGCTSDQSLSPLPFTFYFILPIIISSVGAVYCLCAIRNFISRRRNAPFDNLEDNTMINNQTRLTLLSMSAMVLNLGVNIWIMTAKLPIDTSGYWSWEERKPHLATPVFISRLLLEQPGAGRSVIIFLAYNSCLVAFHFLIFFGFAPEAMKNYRKIWHLTTTILKSAFHSVVSARILSYFKYPVRTIGIAPFMHESNTSKAGSDVVEKTLGGVEEPIATLPLAYSRKERLVAPTVDLPTLPSTLPPAIPLRAPKTID